MFQRYFTAILLVALSLALLFHICWIGEYGVAVIPDAPILYNLEVVGVFLVLLFGIYRVMKESKS